IRYSVERLQTFQACKLYETIFFFHRRKIYDHRVLEEVFRKNENPKSLLECTEKVKFNELNESGQNQFCYWILNVVVVLAISQQYEDAEEVVYRMPDKDWKDHGLVWIANLMRVNGDDDLRPGIISKIENKQIADQMHKVQNQKEEHGAQSREEIDRSIEWEKRSIEFWESFTSKLKNLLEERNFQEAIEHIRGAKQRVLSFDPRLFFPLADMIVEGHFDIVEKFMRNYISGDVPCQPDNVLYHLMKRLVNLDGDFFQQLAKIVQLIKDENTKSFAVCLIAKDRADAGQCDLALEYANGLPQILRTSVYRKVMLKLLEVRAYERIIELADRALYPNGQAS
ncbi:MAG: hypothetical protein MI867_27240, partial [Pseudomonadales bacterium]|nr:hypothetical protein [Pseudomonadales bacterium]